MTLFDGKVSRRAALAAGGVGLGAATLGGLRPAAALTPVRQGYQTNMWGMPT